MTQPEAENWQSYSHDIHKLFADWNGHVPLIRRSPRRLPVIIVLEATAITFIMVALSANIVPRKRAGSA
jgi:hypothetical protein